MAERNPQRSNFTRDRIVVIILDTNIFIYLSNGALKSTVILDEDISHSSVTKIEALGFSIIPADELLLLNELFSLPYGLDLTDNVIDCAIKLRQGKRMTLGDAIIAATALENDLTLWTVNTKDFSHIDSIKMCNPLPKK
ncbi:hypothetical protein BH10PAT3_BH10PAT3_0540 [soil metagenome]